MPKPVDLDKGVMTALTRCRVEAGMTQEELAQRVNDLDLGVTWTRAGVAGMEAGRRRSLRIIEIIALCAVHEMCLADLLIEGGASAQQIATLLGHQTDAGERHKELLLLRRQIKSIRGALGLPPHRDA